MKKISIAVVFMMVIVMSLFSLPIKAETLQQEKAGHLIEGLVPVDSMYYNGHTYLAFTGDFNWYQAKILCEAMGGYLVTLDTEEEQAAVMGLSSLGWTGACAFSGGYTRTWVWDKSDDPIGIMHEPIPGVQGDEFYYIPLSKILWDPLHNEPNSWKTPWDQNVAYLNERGLNTLMPTDMQGFICEFDSIYVFSIVDLNFDMNFDFELDWGFNKVWADYPANYDRKDRLPQKVLRTFGKTNITPEYPDNAQQHYNFRGCSINKDTTSIWLNSTYALTMYDSEYKIFQTPLEKPVVTLYAVWEKAESIPADLECFAASMFAYAKKLEKGKTVSETLNLQENLSWEDIDNDLPLYKNYGHVTMRDFMNSVIGGYVVEDFVRYDEGSTFSAVYLKNANGHGIIAYRGTEFYMAQSRRTDYLMGYGVLNKQFDHALEFYSRHKEKNPILTGHSLGGSLAAHVGIINDVPCYTINSAQGISIPLTLIEKYGSKRFKDEVFSLASNFLDNLHNQIIQINPIVNLANEYFQVFPKAASFEVESAEIFSSYGFYQYQPKLRSYVHEHDLVSKLNRDNMVVEIFSGEKVGLKKAHDIEAMVFYDHETNRYSIAQTARQFPKAVLTGAGDMPSLWAYDAYMEAATKGLITPDIDIDYCGDTSRAEFCRAAVNFIEKYYNKPIMTVLEERNLNPLVFADTDDEAICAAAALSITSGTDAARNLFSPNSIITREQAATMLVNMLKALDANFDAKPAEWIDAHELSPWALNAVNVIYNSGVMSGTSKTTLTFSPKASYTHEQTIVTLNGLWNYLHK